MALARVPLGLAGSASSGRNAHYYGRRIESCSTQAKRSRIRLPGQARSVTFFLCSRSTIA